MTPEQRFDRAMHAARSVQWEKSPARTSERRERISGTAPISDPTSDAALDPRRLRVRDAIKRAQSRIDMGLHSQTRDTDTEELEVAVALWEGWDV